MNRSLLNIEALAVGVSAGGMDALRKILPELPVDFPCALLIVQHLHPHADDFLAMDLNRRSAITVKQADEKEKIKSGFAYIAPPNYHLLVENDGTLSLTICDLINYARPSIDILFETAAEAYRNKLAGVILTGANKDGSRGLKRIKDLGGITIVQDPKTAEVDMMPKAAIQSVEVDFILPLKDIGQFLIKSIKPKIESNEKLKKSGKKNE